MPRGRPKGSKNKKTLERERLETAKEAESPVKRKTGRPKGSKSKYTMSEKSLAQRVQAGRSHMIPEPVTAEEQDFNDRLIRHLFEINEIATHADRHDLVSLRSCFLAYLKLCQKNKISVSNLAAYASMNMDIHSFQAFSTKDDPEIREFCRWVRRTCAMFREALVSENKLNPVIGIFWQRNYDGLRNDTEQVQAIREQEDFSGESKAYKERYRKLIGE